jgi:ketosteroid isomerase-like protein
MLQILSSLTRRAAFAAIAAVALIGAGLIMPTIAQAAGSSDQVAAVAKAVEALRVAMVGGDEKGLNSLVEDHLTYGHSHGKLQNKAEFVKNLVGPNAPGKFNWIKLSDQTIDIVGNVALVRHVFDAENALPDGKTSTAHILVLQVWKKERAGWKLLARQACPL